MSEPWMWSATILVVVLCACGGEQRVLSVSLDTGSSDMVAYGVSENLTASGVLRANLRADSARYFEASDRLDLYDLRVTFLGSSQTTLSVLTAPRGVYWIQANRLEASGAVVVSRALDGATLRTDSLLYDVDRNEFSTDKPWTIPESHRLAPN